MFHDFLGARNCPSDAAASDARTSDSSPAPSLSAGARGRPISSASDPASERQAGSRYEEVPPFVPRGDAEIDRRLVGRKRSSSDSGFPSLGRDKVAQIGSDHPHEDSHLMKVIQNGELEKLRRSNDEYAFAGMQRLQQGSGSLVLRSGNNSRNDATFSKWDRPISMNMGSAVQFPSRIQNSPMASQALPNRFRDVQIGASPITAQAAADEGSRTGIKGPSILSSIKSGVGPEKSSQGLGPSANRALIGSLAEPESSNIPSQNGMRSESRQMTIFYGGQAHVFDDVHPNKAEVIMALAGSNGGSWSTIYSPKPKLKLSNEDDIPLRETSSGAPSNLAFVRDSYGKLPATRDPDPGFGSRDRIPNPAGGPVGRIILKEKRNLVEVTDRAADSKVDS
ncbi:hypothetical protein MLD38_006017 [Melastoma candidum]|uniref:Uncharacterized protein n=1 Tax=Melastoma candidum TaxID=119954 RepID=A0ACB9RMT9_9MYRT|nr:hypothetical protein MLD38_006017 [Melastoma candidum]